MNFLKGFLGGVVFAIALLVLIPMFVGEHVDYTIYTNLNSAKLLVFAEMILGCGVAFGLLFQFLAWIGRRNRERQETDRLMREYLEKKLREEANNEK